MASPWVNTAEGGEHVFMPSTSCRHTQLVLFWLILHIHTNRGVAKNIYLGGLGFNRDILNIIHKSIGYKIINFHISSYTWTLINLKNYLFQCRQIKKKNSHQIMSDDNFSWNKIQPLSSLQWNSLQFPHLYKLSYYLPKAHPPFYCEILFFTTS